MSRKRSYSSGSATNTNATWRGPGGCSPGCIEMGDARDALGVRAGEVAAGVDDVARPEDVDAAREAALRLLERTRRTRSDLERRIRERGFGSELIRSVLDGLVR